MPNHYKIGANEGLEAGLSTPLQSKQQQVAQTSIQKKADLSGQFSSIEEFDALNPNAAPLERFAVQQDINNRDANYRNRTFGDKARNVGQAALGGAASLTGRLATLGSTAINELSGARYNFTDGDYELHERIRKKREESAEYIRTALSPDADERTRKFAEQKVAELSEANYTDEEFRFLEGGRFDQVDEYVTQLERNQAIQRAFDVPASKVDRTAQTRALTAIEETYDDTVATADVGLDMIFNQDDFAGGMGVLSSAIARAAGRTVEALADGELLATTLAESGSTIIASGVSIPLTLASHISGAQQEALGEYIATEGKIPTGEDRTRLNLSATASGILDLVGDRILAGAAKPLTAAAGTGAKTAAGKVAQSAAKAAGAGAGEAFAEGGAAALQDYAVRGEVDEGKAVAQAALGAGVGTALATAGEAPNVAKSLAKAPTEKFAEFRARQAARVEEQQAADAEAQAQEEVTPPVIQAAQELDVAVATPTPDEVSTETQAVKDRLTEMSDEVRVLNDQLQGEDVSLGGLLYAAANIQDEVLGLRKQVLAAEQSGNVSDAEKEYLRSLAEQLDEPGSESITGALAQQIQNTPPLADAMAVAFDAVTTGDTAQLNEVLSIIDEAGRTEDVSNDLVDAMLKTSLYSVDLLGDPDITSAQLNKAAELSKDVDTKQQYEALATIKDIDTVAGEVTDGQGEFTGTNTHLTNIKDALADNNIPQLHRSMTELNDFHQQRIAKADTIRQALANIESGNVEGYEHRKGAAGADIYTAVYNPDPKVGTGSWSIANTPKGIARTNALLAQLDKEVAIVGDALTAANVLTNAPQEAQLDAGQPTGQTEQEVPVEADTQEVDTETDTDVQPSGPDTEPSVQEPASVEPVQEETEQVDTQEFTETVQESPELEPADDIADFVAEATGNIDARINDLNIRIGAMEGTIAADQQAVDALGSDTSARAEFLVNQLDADKAELARMQAQLLSLQDQRTNVERRATQQAEYEATDWDLGTDTTTETKTTHLRSLLGNLIGGFTGKRTLAAIEAEYDVDTASRKSISSSLRDLPLAAMQQVMNFISTLPLTKGDQKVLEDTLGASKSILTAPSVVTDTLASLKETFTGKHAQGLLADNRYRNSVIAYKPMKLWEDNNYLDALYAIDTNMSDNEIIAAVREAGLDTSKVKPTDIDMLKALKTKRNWFQVEMVKRNQVLLDTLTSEDLNQAEFANQALRQLLDTKGRFPQKIIDAAFLAYLSTMDNISDSSYNDNKGIARMLNLTDTAQIADLNSDHVANLRVLGAPVGSNELGRSFNAAMGIKLSNETPLNVQDGVNSAMGGMLLQIMKADPELTHKKEVTSIGQLDGFTLKGADTFIGNMNKGSGLLAQLADSAELHKGNYVGTKPPKVNDTETHIRSMDTLTPEQVQAENIYRDVEHEVDPTVGSFHTQLTLEGFKEFKGYVENTDGYNKEHKLSVEGVNQEIVDTYEKAQNLLDTVAVSDNKGIWFANAFSSVRRQQQRGEVNPQGNKYHRILVGHKNKAKLALYDFNKPELINKDTKAGTQRYNFLLALAQAYGLPVDKTANDETVFKGYEKNGSMQPSMLELLGDIYAQAQTGEGLYADLMRHMNDAGEFDQLISKDLIQALRAETRGSDHHLQGILTVARLLKQADANGRVRNFSHHMRAEIDGLTNGPAHSTVMGGLAEHDTDKVEDIMSKGGYLVGDGTDKNTHQQIGSGALTDFYLTVVGEADTILANVFQELRNTVHNKELPDTDRKAALDKLNNYLFLEDKGVSMQAAYEDPNNPDKVTGFNITRNGTKNPVTVTVYGGGAAGIHAKLASEIRDSFSERLTEIASKPVHKGTLLDELTAWGDAIAPVHMEPLINAVKASRSQKEVKQVLLDFTFSDDFKKETTKSIAGLYGTPITQAIDKVFASNKRSAGLMNLGINFVTALANQTFEQAYMTLLAKRVEEGKIHGELNEDGTFKRAYDTLSSKDVGYIQRQVEKALPYVKTSVQAPTNLAKQGKDSVAGASTDTVRFPVVKEGKPTASSSTPIDHATRSMALPGVRAIPVLTISIDGNTQIKNHLLQGKHGNYLNVLDAIDRVADEGLRASNELFNVAEFMALMESDTIGSVQKAVMGAIKAQMQPIEIEGEQITPNFAEVLKDNTTDSYVTLPQEKLRNALQEMTLPVMEGINVSALDAGNLDNLLGYLLQQLEVERHNNQLKRDAFFFGNPQVAVNQMAGIDNGHANVVKGEVILSDEAKALLDEDGLAMVENFNARQSSKLRTYEQSVADGTETLPDTEIEQLRKAFLEARDAGETEIASMHAAQIEIALGKLGGVWQDLRGNFDFDTQTNTFTIKDNLVAFRKALQATRVNLGETTNDLNVAVPTVGSFLDTALQAKPKKGKQPVHFWERLLKDTKIELVKEIDGESDIQGKSFTEVTTGKRRNTIKRTIQIRLGMSTGDTNRVLAHELIHTATSGGIHAGVLDWVQGNDTVESNLAQDLYRQMGRMIKTYDAMPADKRPASYGRLANLFANTRGTNKSPENLEIALHEYMAHVGSEQEAYQDFLLGHVRKDSLTGIAQKILAKSWQVMRDYLVRAFGKDSNKVKLADAKKPYTSEVNLLNHIFQTLGDRTDLVRAETAGAPATYSRTGDMLDKTAEAVLKGAEATGVEHTFSKAGEYFNYVEKKSDDYLRKGANTAIEGILRGMGYLGSQGAAALANVSPAQREYVMKNAINEVLTGKDTDPRTGFIRTTFAEFFSRSSDRSKTLDRMNDISKHAADSVREDTKVVVANGLSDALGDISQEQSRALLNTVVRGDLLSLTTDPVRLNSLVNNPSSLQNSVDTVVDRINRFPGASQAQKNLMINEALSLGHRMVKGGAYEGFNLPNAKAIVNMSGVNLAAVTQNKAAFERMVDELASLTALQQTSEADLAILSDQLANNYSGLVFLHNQKEDIRNKLFAQYGEGKRYSLPKGFVPDQMNPNRAIKVVEWKDRNKYSGFSFVREFKREAADTNTDKRMALLVSKEGGHIPYVQGAMSTIESTVGGFSTVYGSATDKALPSYRGSEASKIAARKARLTRNFSSSVKAPVKLNEGMVPNISSTGKISGYRYVIDNAEREQHLETVSDVIDVVSAYNARLGEQQIAERFNKQLVDELHRQYTEADNKDEFALVSPNSSDEHLRELWRVIPEHTRKAIREKFGDNKIYVHKRDLDNALGYREWSISKLWDAQAEPGSLRAAAVDLIETVLGNDAMSRLRFAERVLQEAVIAAKDMIVVKSIVVPGANIVSNLVHLTMRGMNPVDVIRHARVASNGLNQYREDIKALRSAENHQAVTGEDRSEEIANLQRSINRNPIAFMVEEGLLPSVVEDISGLTHQGTVKEGILDRYIPKAIRESDNKFIDIGKEIVITQDSRIYKFLNSALEQGDFVAKYALYNHLRETENMSQADALDQVRSEFINYNTLNNRQLDYLNKTGGVFFFKYFSRIQPIIYNAIRNNPTRMLTTWIGADTVGLPSIFDAMLLGKDITATTGAYDLLNMAGGAHPIEGLM